MSGDTEETARTAPQPAVPSAGRTAVVLMGVSGCGKTVVGEHLAELTGGEFVDGDDLHPAANVEKMSRGEPLDDGDRAGWLEVIRARIEAGLAADGAGPFIVGCSALKRTYRDVLRRDEPPGRVRVVFLRGDEALIAERLDARRGHFMPPGLLRSQFEALEEPGAPGDEALVVDISGPAEDVAAAAAAALAKPLDRAEGSDAG